MLQIESEKGVDQYCFLLDKVATDYPPTHGTIPTERCLKIRQKHVRRQYVSSKTRSFEHTLGHHARLRRTMYQVAQNTQDTQHNAQQLFGQLQSLQKGNSLVVTATVQQPTSLINHYTAMRINYIRYDLNLNSGTLSRTDLKKSIQLKR